MYEGIETLNNNKKQKFNVVIIQGDVFDYVKVAQAKTLDFLVSTHWADIIPYLQKKYKLKKNTKYVEDLTDLHTYNTYKKLYLIELVNNTPMRQEIDVGEDTKLQTV